MLAEELVVVDAESSLWGEVRSLLEAALRLEQRDETYSWHGWQKTSLNAFLQRLPAQCSLLVGVWDHKDVSRSQVGDQESEMLVLGFICEVVNGEVTSLRTFEALHDANLPPVMQLEPGYQHALELIRATRAQIAPVAWALFTDKQTWDEWLLSEGEGENVIDKGDLLASLARQGRCVLMGSQTAHHQIHHHI